MMVKHKIRSRRDRIPFAVLGIDEGNCEQKSQSSPGEVELVLPQLDFSLGYFTQFIAFSRVIGDDVTWFSAVKARLILDAVFTFRRSEFPLWSR